MKGIDVYQGESKNGLSSQLKAIPEKAYKESDFVIVKSTQGLSYGYTAFFKNMINRVLSDGKLAGAYHYASGHDAKAEADYFISVVKPYIGKIVLVLDWEAYQNKAWGSKTWARTFVNRVKEKTGITCMLYTGSDGCKQCSNLIGTCPLWFAGYPDLRSSWVVPAFKYDLGGWKDYAIWQYTSSDEVVDRNTCKLTKNEWKELASGKKATTAKKKAVKYTGTLPSFPLLRSYYKNGDGIVRLKNYPTQIKRVQNALNWALSGVSGFSKLTVDGQYGNATEKAVRLFQTRYKFKDVNGKWGKLCNAQMKKIEK